MTSVSGLPTFALVPGGRVLWGVNMREWHVEEKWRLVLRHVTDELLGKRRIPVRERGEIDWRLNNVSITCKAQGEGRMGRAASVYQVVVGERHKDLIIASA